MVLKKIAIDRQKCTTPFACKICLQVCPQAVFTVWPAKIEKFKETDAREPGAWKLLPNYADKCTGCNDCVELCPLQAITLVYEGSEL